MLKNYTLRFNVFLICVVLCTGCTGWKVADSLKHEKTAVRVPYVQGDVSGQLTAQLIQAVHNQPGFIIDETAQYELKVKLLHNKDEKIGFRYDPIELEKQKKELILNETRTKTLAMVTIVDKQKNRSIIGPAYILGSIEYDHQQNTIDTNIQQLSAGQLADIDTIQDTKHIPIFRDLANKISIWLQNQMDLQSLNTHTL